MREAADLVPHFTQAMTEVCVDPLLGQDMGPVFVQVFPEGA